MFLGTHSPRLDEKGRMFLPAKYREELAAGVVITKGQERCLYVFPVAEFARITEALSTTPVTAKAVRDYSRVFFASASDWNCPARCTGRYEHILELIQISEHMRAPGANNVKALHGLQPLGVG